MGAPPVLGKCRLGPAPHPIRIGARNFH